MLNIYVPQQLPCSQLVQMHSDVFLSRNCFSNKLYFSLGSSNVLGFFLRGGLAFRQNSTRYIAWPKQMSGGVASKKKKHLTCTCLLLSSTHGSAEVSCSPRGPALGFKTIILSDHDPSWPTDDIWRRLAHLSSIWISGSDIHTSQQELLGFCVFYFQ